MKKFQILTNLKTLQCGVREYTNIIFGDNKDYVILLRKNVDNLTQDCLCHVQFHPHSISPGGFEELIWRISHKYNSKVVVTIHDDETFKRYADTFDLADGVIVPSSNLKDACQKFIQKEIKVIPQPCSIFDKNTLEKDYDTKLIVYHGFPGSEKRFKEVIDNLYNYDKTLKHLILSCGDNNKRMSYLTNIAERYQPPIVKIIPGFITRYEIVKRMSGALCNICFYKEQPTVRSSSAVTNPISARIPVIISNCNSLSWLNKNYNVGCIVETYDQINYVVNKLQDIEFRDDCIVKIEKAYDLMRSDNILKLHEEYYARI